MCPGFGVEIQETCMEVLSVFPICYMVVVMVGKLMVKICEASVCKCCC